MSYELRGIVEGFYGTPWTHEERLDMFAFMRAHELNAYIYAPKDDELHRDKWRAPYDEASLARFGALADAARNHSIFFTFAMSPGLDLRYSDDSEVDVLMAKLEPLLALDIPSIGIFFDDVPPHLEQTVDQERYDNLGEAQADFLTRVQARLGDVHLITVPTYYCGSPERPYLYSLGTMPAAIDVMWTGPAICSEKISNEHMEAVAVVLQREPIVWDNYPVNDAAMIAELHIGPYRGRDGNLPVRGVYANPMSLVAASKLPLATFADYASDPNWYAPEQSWQHTAQAMLGQELAEALSVFAESVTISPLTPEQPQAMLDLIEPFEENRLPYTPNPAPEHLRQGTARMRQAHDQLVEASSKVPFLSEIEPWLDEYGRWIDMLEDAYAYIEIRFASEEEAEGDRLETLTQIRDRIRAGLKEAVDFRTVTCGDVVRNFLQDLVRKTGEPLA